MEASARRKTPVRFVLLLGLILCMLVLDPLPAPFVAVDFLVNLFMTAVFLGTLYSVSHERRLMVAAAVILLPGIVATWLPGVPPASALAAVGKVSGTAFFGLSVYGILRFVSRQRQVTVEVIFASLVAYLLMAILWSYLYLLTEAVAPGAFESIAGLTAPQQHKTLL